MTGETKGRETTTTADQLGDLRAIGLRSGAVLMSREGGGMAVRLIGVILLTNIIGPSEYGLYAGSVAIVFVLTVLAQLSAELFLIRQVEDLDRNRCDEVFSFLAVVSFSTMFVAMAIGALVARRTDLPTTPLLLLLVSVPASVLWAPAQAQLERSFRFGRLGALEFGGDIVLYAVALPLAWAGHGATGAAVGFVAWQLYLLIGSCILVPYLPRWRWSPEINRSVVSFGMGLTLAQCMRRGRELVNPIVVGPLAGGAAVGIVALAMRLMETASALARVVSRVVFAGLSRLQANRTRFGARMSEAISVQLLLLGLLLGVGAVAAPVFLPAVFGDEWKPVLALFPWLAWAAMFDSVATAMGQGLTIFGRTGSIGGVETVRTVMLALVALPMVAWHGPAGFGVAVLVAVLPIIWLWRLAVREFPLDLTLALPWLIGFSPLMLAAVVAVPWRYLLCIPAAACLVLEPGRSRVIVLSTALRTSLRRAST